MGGALPTLDLAKYDDALAGSDARWGDYEKDEKIDHVDGYTVEEAEHQIATRIYQNTAKAHFNAHAQKDDRFGRRIVYGGHVISLARTLTFNGLANAFHVAAINGGRHVAPCFAGDTIYAGRKYSRPHRSMAATIWARCACAQLPPRISPAPNFPTKSTKRPTPKASSSISIIGW